MKKILIFIALIIIGLLLIIPKVNAEEIIDVTENIEVKTKWYKEEIEEKYHKKGESLEGYIEDASKTIKGNIIEWRKGICTKDEEKRIVRSYKLYNYTQFIRLSNLNNYKEIQILYQNNKINYEIIKKEENIMIIKLPEAYETHNLLVFIDTEETYNIELSNIDIFSDSKIYKNNIKEKILYVDDTWQTTENSYTTVVTLNEEIYSSKVILLNEYEECATYEELTYRYKINKIYYDDNFHTFIEGYKRDTSKIKYYYNGPPLIKEIEIPKEVEIIKKVEVPKEIIITKEKIVKEEPKIITEYIEKECEEKIIIENKEVIKSNKKNTKNIIHIIIIISIMIGLLIIKKLSTKRNI